MTTFRYVDTAADGTGDGTTRAHTTATGAYASLSSWESSEQATLSADHIVRCAGSTDDTTAVSVSGWTAGSNSIFIKGDKGEDDSSGGGDDGSGFDYDGFYDGNFSWHDSYYRLIQSAGFQTLSVSEENVEIHGIQLHNDRASAGASAARATYSLTVVEHCRLGCTSGDAILGSSGTFRSYQKRINNNIIYKAGGSGILMSRIDSAPTNTTDVYNNTIYDCATGIKITGDNTGDTYNIKNNCVFNCTTEYSGLDNDTNAVINSTHNAGEGSAPTGHNSDWITLSTTITDDITDPENAGGPAADDLRPVASGNLDGAGIGSGTDSGAPTTDITGASRSTSAPSIGAFELIAVVGGGTNKGFFAMM